MFDSNGVWLGNLYLLIALFAWRRPERMRIESNVPFRSQQSQRTRMNERYFIKPKKKKREMWNTFILSPMKW